MFINRDAYLQPNPLWETATHSANGTIDYLHNTEYRIIDFVDIAETSAFMNFP